MWAETGIRGAALKCWKYLTKIVYRVLRSDENKIKQ